MNGKGRGPEKGYNRQAYAENYDAIFRTNQRKEPMKTPEQEQPNQPTVLPWLKEAIEEICLELPGGYNCDPQWVCDMLRDKGGAIIARHDPHAAQHATTLRLLREADEVLCDVSRYPVASAYPDGPCLERETHDNVCKLLIAIRAHLAAHSKPDEKKGSK